MMTLGKKLNDLRTAKNLTREKLAQELGISKVAYGKWESDIAKPNFNNIAVICDYYKISKDELMSEEKNINQTNNVFNSSPNIINSQSPVINYTLPNEIIEKILDNQKQVSEIIASQNVLFQKVFSKL